MWDEIGSGESASEINWAAYAARRSLFFAIEAMDAATTALGPLIDASTWQAKGVQSMRTVLEAERSSAVAELHAMHYAAVQVRGVRWWLMG